MDEFTQKKPNSEDSMKNERELRRKEEELLGNRNPFEPDPEGVPPHQPNALEKDRYPKSHDR